ncbi:DUF1549 and DUF1553 domain-containing protein [bacterium]|nr:DUF1549 and DUF1553 domain-containing protein [bacterium]
MKNTIAIILLGAWAIGPNLAGAGDSLPISYRDRLEELRKVRHRKNAVPPTNAADPVPTISARPDYIDPMLAQSWKEINATVAEPATDGEWLRRSSIDLLGRIPTLAENKEFLSSRSSAKRSQWIDRCLQSPEFGTNLANIWMKLLMPAGVLDQDVDRDGLHAWLEREFNRGRPWNEMVTELLTAEGRSNENPATNFLLATQENGNSIRTTSMVTKLFLGVQTQCTECHDHPWNAWKQDQFHGMNAFFLGTRERRATKPQGGGLMTDYWMLEDIPLDQVAMKGVFFERRNGLSVFTEPTYLDGRSVQTLAGIKKNADDVRDYLRPEDSADAPAQGVRLRAELAKAITADSNPYFARAMVNRLWYHFFGHSFTKNVDDFDNGLDEPTMPELLDRLAGDFRTSKYNVKELARRITTTKAYGLSSKRKTKKNEDSLGFFSYQLVRPLSPEQLYDSLLTLTRLQDTSKESNTGKERQGFIDEMLRSFGTDAIPTAAPTYDGTITQSLMLMNSPLVGRLTSCVPGSFLHEVATDEKMNDKEKVDAIYLSALSRKPTSAESKIIAAMIEQTPEDKKPEVFVDVLWSVINSAEFLLNH